VCVQDDEVNFNVLEAMKHPSDRKKCFRMDVLDEICWGVQDNIAMIDPLEKVVTSHLEGLNDKEEEDIKKCLEELDKANEISFVVTQKLELSSKNRT